MRADVHTLNSVLLLRQQWVVPVYQRHYEWEITTDKQLPTFWDDLKEKAIERFDNRIPFPHYFGAIIFSESQNQPYGAVPQRFMVDGQQRITTFQLALTALREAARDYQSQRLVDAISAYLYNDQNSSMENPDRERFKLWPSSFDRVLYKEIVENSFDDLRITHKSCFYKNGKLIRGKSPKLLQAFWYLYDQINTFIEERLTDDENPEQILHGLLDGFLSGFQIVVIQLDPNDDAQEIFASLNSMGKPLSPFDLIRNDIFHRAQKMGEDDQKIFDEHWKNFEVPFWSTEVRQGRLKRARADHLIAHSVVAEMAREVNVGKIATEYQHYARERAFATIVDELSVLLGHASTYRAMEEHAPDTIFSQITNVLQIWDMSTFHPLVLWINAQPFEDIDKIKLFDLMESYIIRREICGLTSKNYNKVVTAIIRHALDHDDPVTAIINYVSNLSGDASRMPDDTQIKEAMSGRTVYSKYNNVVPQPRLRYILQQIEYDKRNKFDEPTMLPNNLTIEHIMPQSWAEHWPLPNGVIAPCEFTWQREAHELDDENKRLMDLRQHAVGTIGNLTLVNDALNPSMGNAAWETKQPRLGKSLLVLNREIATKAHWNEETIKQRADDLATITNRVWKSHRSQ